MKTNQVNEDSGCPCCKCGRLTGSDEAHPCPYAQEIYGDSEPACNCCPDCEDECAQNI